MLTNSPSTSWAGPWIAQQWAVLGRLLYKFFGNGYGQSPNCYGHSVIWYVRVTSLVRGHVLGGVWIQRTPTAQRYFLKTVDREERFVFGWSRTLGPLDPQPTPTQGRPPGSTMTRPNPTRSERVESTLSTMVSCSRARGGTRSNQSWLYMPTLIVYTDSETRYTVLFKLQCHLH